MVSSMFIIIFLTITGVGLLRDISMSGISALLLPLFFGRLSADSVNNLFISAWLVVGAGVAALSSANSVTAIIKEPMLVMKHKPDITHSVIPAGGDKKKKKKGGEPHN